MADAVESGNVLRADDGESLYRQCSSGGTTTTSSAARAAFTAVVDGPAVAELRATGGGGPRLLRCVQHTAEIFGSAAACARTYE
jgi:hypothetical protein